MDSLQFELREEKLVCRDSVDRNLFISLSLERSVRKSSYLILHDGAKNARTDIDNFKEVSLGAA